MFKSNQTPARLLACAALCLFVTTAGAQAIDPQVNKLLTEQRWGEALSA